MKHIFSRGLLIGFSVGVLLFIVWFLFDVASRAWRPLIMALFQREYLVIPLTLVFTLIVVIILGYVFSPNRLSGRGRKLLARVPVLNWFLGDSRIPENARDMPGVLVRFSDDAYFIGALTGEQKLIRKDGKVHVMYKVYCPSAPIPWSGLPIIFVAREQVVLLKITFGDVYRIITSFGRDVRPVIEELTFPDDEEDLIVTEELKEKLFLG